jgi:HEAT repeat protein
VAWFSLGTKVPQLHILENEIKESSLNFSQDLKDKLQQLNFEEKWGLTKRLLPVLEKTKTRNLVRFFFSDKTDKIVDLLEKREETNIVVECLGYFPSRETVEILVNFLNHKNEETQLIAAGALTNHTPRLVVPCVMEKFLEGEIPASRAGDVLLGMDYLAQEALLEAYEEATVEVKGQILELLTVSRNPKCKQFLASALLSGEVVLKKAALQAVSVFKLRELWLEVAMCLVEPAWQIRTKAMEVLSELKVKEALEMIIPFSEDEDPWVRKAAETCIEKLEKE